MKHLLLCLLFLPSTARAGEAGPPQADLGALLREAAANPALRAAEARLEAARRVPSQAGARPDPEVGLAYVNDGTHSFTFGESEFSTLALSWTQEAPYPGKRSAATRVATLDAERLERDLARLHLETAAAVKSAWADLYRLDRAAALLSESRSVLESLAEGARRRYEVGQGIQESVLKAQTEILRLDASAARVTQERRAAEVRLGALVGRSGAASIGPVDALPAAALPEAASGGGATGTAEDDERIASVATAGSAEVASLEAAVRREEAGVGRARLDLKPDFVWSASYQDRGGLDPMIMGSIGVRLPLSRKQKQAQALLQRQSELTAARQDLAGGRLRAGAEARDLVSQLRRAESLLVLLREGLIPQARSTLESARSSYAAGRIGFLDLLNDLTVLFDARIELAAQEADRFRILAALEPLLGRELIVVEDAGGGAGSPAARGGGEGGNHEPPR